MKRAETLMEQGRRAPWETGRNEPEDEGARKPRYINEPHLQNLGFVISNSKFRGAVHPSAGSVYFHD